MENKDYILLKWGTLKGWSLKNSPEAFTALQEYCKEEISMSAMAKKDTPRQKELICEMIDKVNGVVENDWDGVVYENKEDAKKYVMEYGKTNA